MNNAAITRPLMPSERSPNLCHKKWHTLIFKNLDEFIGSHSTLRSYPHIYVSTTPYSTFSNPNNQNKNCHWGLGFVKKGLGFVGVLLSNSYKTPAIKQDFFLFISTILGLYYYGGILCNNAAITRPLMPSARSPNLCHKTWNTLLCTNLDE